MTENCVIEHIKNFQNAGQQHRLELTWFGLVAFFGVFSRLVFILVFPPQPVSDFFYILDFAQQFTRHVFAEGATAWQLFSPGTSFFLSLFLRLFPFPPEIVARNLTAVLTGLLPLIPFLLWKDVFSLRARVVTALLLALYPAQIIFSGVVAQDNWVLLPTVALGALAVRVVALKSSGSPFWAAALLVSAFFIRQEMLAVLLPVCLVVMAGCEKRQVIKNIAKGALITALLLGLLVLQRGAATGRFSLTTAHLGGSILGSYVPGAEMSWLDPRVLVAARAPELLENDRYKERASDLVWNEFLLRPGYHTVRVLFSPFLHIIGMENGSAYWGLTAPGALTDDRRPAALFFVERFLPGLRYFSHIVHILFLASLFFIILERKFAYTVALLAAIALKMGFHALIVSQARYFLVVYVLEVLIIGSLLDHLLSRRYFASSFFSNRSLKTLNFRNGFTYLALGLIAFVGIHQSTKYAENYLIRADENIRVTYQFPVPVSKTEIHCQVSAGRLLYFQHGNSSRPGKIVMDFRQADPAPGSHVVLTCKTSVQATQPILMRIQDNYPTGNLPGRIIQVVTINAEEVYRHDIAATPGAGWHDIPLDGYPAGTPLEIQVTLLAENPDFGWAWGRAAITEVQFTGKE